MHVYRMWSLLFQHQVEQASYLETSQRHKRDRALGFNFLFKCFFIFLNSTTRQDVQDWNPVVSAFNKLVWPWKSPLICCEMCHGKWMCCSSCCGYWSPTGVWSSLCSLWLNCGIHQLIRSCLKPRSYGKEIKIEKLSVTQSLYVQGLNHNKWQEYYFPGH